MRRRQWRAEQTGEMDRSSAHEKRAHTEQQIKQQREKTKEEKTNKRKIHRDAGSDG